MNAITRRKKRIDIESANKAIAKERSDYQALLERGHYEALRQRHADKTLVNEEVVRALLHNLSLLEYANDEVWCDVHPVVLPLIEK